MEFFCIEIVIINNVKSLSIILIIKKFIKLSLNVFAKIDKMIKTNQILLMCTFTFPKQHIQYKNILFT